MEERHPDLIVAKKDYTPFPINATGLFKPKDLYLLAGMYLSTSYQMNSNILHTDITISQLSSLTGVSEEYICNYFYPRLKRSRFVGYRCIQEQPLVKRNHLTAQEADERISLQIPMEEKKKKANYIIDNSKDLENLQREVEKYLQNYLSKLDF